MKGSSENEHKKNQIRAALEPYRHDAIGRMKCRMGIGSAIHVGRPTLRYVNGRWHRLAKVK